MTLQYLKRHIKIYYILEYIQIKVEFHTCFTKHPIITDYTSAELYIMLCNLNSQRDIFPHYFDFLEACTCKTKILGATLYHEFLPCLPPKKTLKISFPQLLWPLKKLNLTFSHLVVLLEKFSFIFRCCPFM